MVRTLYLAAQEQVLAVWLYLSSLRLFRYPSIKEPFWNGSPQSLGSQWKLFKSLVSGALLGSIGRLSFLASSLATARFSQKCFPNGFLIRDLLSGDLRRRDHGRRRKVLPHPRRFPGRDDRRHPLQVGTLFRTRVKLNPLASEHWLAHRDLSFLSFTHQRHHRLFSNCEFVLSIYLPTSTNSLQVFSSSPFQIFFRLSLFHNCTLIPACHVPWEIVFLLILPCVMNDLLFLLPFLSLRFHLH